MPLRSRGAVALAIAAVLTLGGLAGVASAASGARLSNRYCSALGDFYDLSLDVQLATSVSDPQAAEATRIQLLLLLSPKLEAVSKTLSNGGTRVLNRAYRREAQVFHRGVVLLKQAHLTRKQIRALRNADITETQGGLVDLLGDVDTSTEDFIRAEVTFAPALDNLTIGVDEKVTREFEAAGTKCGVLSTGIDCDTVFSPADAGAIIGAPTQQIGGGCNYITGESDDPPEVAVEVYESVRAFSVITKNVEGSAVNGVGEKAVTFPGFRAYAGVRSCGQTLVVRNDAVTMVVALCLPNDAPVPVERLVSIANTSLTRLGAGG